MSHAWCQGWEKRQFASPAALELEGGSSICYADSGDEGYTVTMALAQLCVHTVPSAAVIVVVLLWYPGTYRTFCLLCSADEGESKKHST